MWSPPNKQALPSQEEMKYAREAIDELESELKVAIQILERAKRHVAVLTQDLEERKAWIAPVRKVPFEILSEIFIFTSEVDDLSPVTITEVCCFWRKVILLTPRAWSLIYADRLTKNGGEWGDFAKTVLYFSTFIKRSNPCMLHVTMPDQDYFDEEDEPLTKHPAQKPLVSAIHRVKCLSTSSWQIVYSGPEAFPHLTKLTLLNGGIDIASCFFNRSRFPCLQYLDCTNCPLDDSLVVATLLPPLQHLSVNTKYSGWIELVRGCADTLVALVVIDGVGAKRIPGAAISFPKLNSLAFGTRSNVATGVIWPIQATTPSLRSYEQTRLKGRHQPVAHHDVKNVTHLLIDQTMDLEEFIALRVLQFELRGPYSPSHVIHTTLNRLKENKNVCPVLQTIRFSLSEKDCGDSFKSLIPGFDNTVRRARPDITLLFTNNSHIPLPGSFEEAQCGRDMPCASKPDRR